jgi:hypothetical protein
LEELAKSSSKEHKDFPESLKLYLSQDAEAYNFDKMDKIFLFKYGMNIIGSTSPVTLFCPSATDLSKLDIRRMTEDRGLAFGENSLPLYKRTFDFQKWFYFLLAVCKTELSSDVNKNLSCIYEYARLSLGQQSGADADALSHIFESKPKKDDFGNDYFPLNTKGENTPVDILGIELYVGKPGAIDESLLKSDFAIKATKDYKDTQPPLVLQNGFAKPGWIYLRKLLWQASIAVESKVDTPWMEKREMPGFSDI